MERMGRRSFALAAALLFCAACASPRHVAPLPPPIDPRTQMAALEMRIFDLVQIERHKIDPNAKGLMLDSELVGAARRHTRDMAQKNYLAHTAPNGETVASIIMDEDAKFQGLLGENIAAEHFVPQVGIDVNTMAHAFVDLWLKSPKHRDNLSLAAYDRTGVGAAVAGNTVYATQLFAADLGLPPPQDDPPPGTNTGPSTGTPPHAAHAVPLPAARPGH
jgi:uncharacterized protein YkwD